jgi:hypothetical protein
MKHDCVLEKNYQKNNFLSFKFIFMGQVCFTRPRGGQCCASMIWRSVSTTRAAASCRSSSSRPSSLRERCVKAACAHSRHPHDECHRQLCRAVSIPGPVVAVSAAGPVSLELGAHTHGCAASRTGAAAAASSCGCAPWHAATPGTSPRGPSCAATC